MTKNIAARRIGHAGLDSATRWAQAGVLGSALLLGGAPAVQAADIGSLIGGVVGGMMAQQQRQYYAPQPQYYQAQPQYYQQQPHYYQQQPRYQAQPHRNTATASTRQKAPEKAEKKEQEEAKTPIVAAVGGDASGAMDIAMKRKSGNLWVPAQINKVVTIDFVIDSGASDITLPRDVYLTLIRSGTLTKSHYLGDAKFGIADGSEVKGLKFKLASLQVGNQVLTDVIASVMPSDSATPLLGLSFLSRFQSWAIDNNSGMLKLTPKGVAPTQVAAATSLPMPEQTTIAPPTAEATPAATSAQMAASVPPPQAPQHEPPTTGPAPAQAATPAQPAPAAPQAATTAATTATTEQQLAALNAPRSGQVGTSAFIVKESSGSPAPAPAAPSTTPAAPPTVVASAAPAGPSAGAAAAQAETKPVVPVFPANTPYASARLSLQALGYGPAPLSDAGKCDANTDTTCFPERLACAKTDSIQCEFLWRRGEQLIRVRTVAVPPTVSAVECQVNCK